MAKKETINVQGTEITIISRQENDYICIFKPLEFEGFRRDAGLNAFTLEGIVNII